jgi:hypothetical protein
MNQDFKKNTAKIDEFSLFFEKEIKSFDEVV